MTIHRFIVPKENIDEAQALATLTNEKQVHQISKVLRARPGQTLELLDGDGNLYICIISQISRNQVQAEITQVSREPLDNSRAKINIVLALLKGEQFEVAIQKLTELGVSSISPCLTNHTIVKLKDNDLEKKYQRWLSIVSEATEQSEGFRLPHLNRPQALEVILRELSLDKMALNIFLAERGQSPPLMNLLEPISMQSAEQANSINLVIGPEGGFSDQEFELAQSLDFHFATLGKRVFKATTAAITAAAAVSFFLDNVQFKRNNGTG